MVKKSLTYKNNIDFFIFNGSYDYEPTAKMKGGQHKRNNTWALWGKCVKILGIPRFSKNKKGYEMETEYKKEYIDQVKKLCKLGAIDEEIAEFFGVSSKTIRRWRCQFPAFSAAMGIGKLQCDKRVERSLYHRAIGYTIEEEYMDEKTGLVKSVRKQIPADTKAATYWLENRRRGKWASRFLHASDPEAPLITSINVKLVSDAGEE